MKGGNKFLVWSKGYAFQKQRQLLYCWLAGVSTLFTAVGLILAQKLAFNVAYIPLPVFAIVFCMALFFKNYFFNVKVLLQVQLKYLLKQKEERCLDNYKYFVN